MKNYVRVIGSLAVTGLLLCSMLVGISPVFYLVQETSLYAPSKEANRLHAALFIRQGRDGKWYGEDRVDPLFWGTTTHLLQGESHRIALAVLDRFLSDPEKSVGPLTPVQRAFLQNDLWRLFNWAAESERRNFHSHKASALMKRLGPAIKCLALSEEEIRNLPDNLAQGAGGQNTSDLPDFDSRNSGWVALASQDSYYTAPSHVHQFEGRSTFTVYLRLPAGREETLSFIKVLAGVKEPLTHIKELAEVTFGGAPPWLRKDLPVAPLGTQFALLRKLVVIDDQGRPVSTPLVQTIQVRSMVKSGLSPVHPPQDLKEFTLRRASLFKGKPSLEGFPKEPPIFLIF